MNLRKGKEIQVKPRESSGSRHGAAKLSRYQVLVECQGEKDQRGVFEQMRAAGYRCRVLTLALEVIEKGCRRGA